MGEDPCKVGVIRSPISGRNVLLHATIFNEPEDGEKNGLQKDRLWLKNIIIIHYNYTKTPLGYVEVIYGRQEAGG